jgi:hypothetical protein
MIKRLAIGPGAMGYFIFLGILSKLKQEGSLNELEEISGSSAGAVLAFLYCLAKGDTTKVLDYSLDVPIKNVTKLNLKNFLLNYGLVPFSRVRDLIQRAPHEFRIKIDLTFQDLYNFFPIKIHIASFCVDLSKTVYFSVDTHPAMSVVDAICASIAVPLYFSPLKMNDGWHYIDGGTAETLPGGPFLGKEATGLRLTWGKPIPIKDLKSYGRSVFYSTMHLRSNYDEMESIDINVDDLDLFNYGASNETKLRWFLLGYNFSH